VFKKILLAPVTSDR